MQRAFLLGVLCCFVLPAGAATFTVNSTVDAADAAPGNGTCETAAGNGTCTLRAALQEAGALSGAQTIVVPAGTYVLSTPTACSYGYRDIDGTIYPRTDTVSALCVVGNITLQGAGASSTVIDAGGTSQTGDWRGMVISASATADIGGLTVQNGYSTVGGGGITNHGTLKLGNCAIKDNRGSGDGAGLLNAGTLTMDRCVLQGNSLSSNQGGAFSNRMGAAATITNSTFSFNASGGAGGAIVNVGTLAVASSAFDDNTAGTTGGAINTIGDLTLTDVTVSGNTAANAGGISVGDGVRGSLTANNITVAFNHDTNFVGGIWANGVPVKLQNSIVGANQSDTGSPDCRGSVTSNGHNLVGNTSGCFLTGATGGDLLGQSPGLAPLADNGGTTKTHALVAGSAAIDGGDPGTPGSGGTACAAIDQRGFFRPLGAHCDIGAYERPAAFSVAAIQPAHAANVGVISAVIAGAGIESGATVALRRAGQTDIAGGLVTVQAGNAALAASFNLGGAPAGAWDVVVTNPDQTSAILASGFTVDAGGAPEVWSDIVGPLVVRPGSTARFMVVYGNRGNAEAMAVPLTLSIPALTSLTLLTAVAAPPAQAGQTPVDWSQAPVYVLPGPANGAVNVPLLLPIVPPGFTGVLRFTLDVPSTLGEGDSFLFAATTSDPYLNPDLATGVLDTLVSGTQGYAQSNLGVAIPDTTRPALAQYEQNQFLNAVANGRAEFAAEVGSSRLVYSLGQFTIDAAEYGVAKASAMTGPHALGMVKIAGSSPPTSPPKCNTGAVMAEGSSSCVDDHRKVPDPANEKFTPADCRALANHYVSADGTMCVPNPGTCSLFQIPFHTDPNCARVPIKTSVDPNAKWGPAGVDAAHFRKESSAFSYEIEFENLAAASLPAQSVVVTDQLDTHALDLTTFSLGPISIGSYTITPPPGLKTFTTGLDLRPGTQVEVKVDAALDTSTGVVTWRFTSLDPATGEPTTDPAVGFLPPDVTPPEGQGHLVYYVDPAVALSDGVQVCNQASIVFDANAPISTNTWCNTLDIAPPATHVAALPATVTGNTVTVQWTGTDAGSGIADYSIYVSDNGGSYSPWLTATKATQGDFTGTTGHQYSFYSVGRDLVGNIETSKAQAEATVSFASNSPPPPPPDFQVAASPASLTVAPGNSAQSTITLTPSGGFAESVSLSCSGLPAGATCAFSPASVTLGNAAASSTLTISTTQRTAMNARPQSPSPGAPGGLVLVGIVAPAIVFRRRSWRAHRSRLWALLGAGLLLLQACSGHHSGSSSNDGGGTQSGGTPAGAYTVTVTATGGTLTHSTTLTLTVN